jgi:hypothetical protein
MNNWNYHFNKKEKKMVSEKVHKSEPNYIYLIKIDPKKLFK